MEKKRNNKSASTNVFFRTEETQRPAQTAQTAQPIATKSSVATMAPPKAATPPAHNAKPPTHEEIGERAKVIWKAHGCQTGHDRENWLEAEAQLRKERGLA